MMRLPKSSNAGMSKVGFTLAEVAVTIAIVGVVLVFSVQGLNNSMFQAANTRDLKIARELGLFKIAQFPLGGRAGRRAV